MHAHIRGRSPPLSSLPYLVLGRGLSLARCPDHGLGLILQLYGGDAVDISSRQLGVQFGALGLHMEVNRESRKCVCANQIRLCKCVWCALRGEGCGKRTEHVFIHSLPDLSLTVLI